MGRKRRSWSKKAEKEYERYEREEAEKKAKDRADSEHRHEQIKVLWDLDEQRLSASKNKDRKLTEQKLKHRKLKDLRESLSARVARPYEFHERSQLFIGAHDETLTVAMRVNNPDCSSFKVES